MEGVLLSEDYYFIYHIELDRFPAAEEDCLALNPGSWLCIGEGQTYTDISYTFNTFSTLDEARTALSHIRAALCGPRAYN